ncbi:hypothetical protein [Pseudodonghicola xiamenensis]|uniref:J domain-containing protein n=1 Tax=Pseudodonghicola xiamenensis TaxID=337702 RepID=A0A8J3MBJ7_9RHOB|nr:hypothetical protein [Pseudodonghicola xiamenensis]GHG80561.1 hypothetical protein GCM10010961_03820 [Pseudodonghicola xiamenensis]
MSADAVGWPWDVLGLEGATQDSRVIRRAYAKRLKSLDQGDVSAFQALRGAYEYAVSQSDKGKAEARPLVIQALAGGSGEEARLPVPPGDVTLPDPGQQTDAPSDGSEPERFAPREPISASSVGEASALTEEDQDEDAAIIERARNLIALNMFRTAGWQPLLEQRAMMSREATQQLEWLLITRLNKPVKMPYTPTPPGSWIRLVDEHFGWLQDGIGFSRRFGMMHLAMQRVVEARTAAAPAVEKVKVASGVKIAAWIVALIMLIRGLSYMEVTRDVGPALLTALLLVSLTFGLWMLIGVRVLAFIVRRSPAMQRFLGRSMRWWNGTTLRIPRRSLLYLSLVLGMTAWLFFVFPKGSDHPSLRLGIPKAEQ